LPSLRTVVAGTAIFGWLWYCRKTEVYDDINTDEEQKPNKCNPDTGVSPLRITQQLKISNS